MFKRLYGYIEAILYHLSRISLALEDIAIALHVKPEPEPEPEPEPVDVWRGWEGKKMEEWPERVGGVRVAYVRVCEPRSPLLEVNKNGEVVAYENPLLRAGGDTASQRIVAKEGRWVMVYPAGDVYRAKDKRVRPFGEEIDGDDWYYLVMNEQTIDGINLWEIGETLYINYLHTDDIYML